MRRAVIPRLARHAAVVAATALRTIVAVAVALLVAAVAGAPLMVVGAAQAGIHIASLTRSPQAWGLLPFTCPSAQYFFRVSCFPPTTLGAPPCYI